MKITKIFLLALLFALASSCTENYSNGERIGVITQFSNTGLIWKSHEGHLNVTQTGMNSSVPFDFSVDRDNENPTVIKTLDSAADKGWKVKIIYHETAGKNWFSNRGQTDHFVNKVEVLDKNMASIFNNRNQQVTGHVIDTVYIVIDKEEMRKQLRAKGKL